MNIEEHIKEDFSKFKCINCHLSYISTVHVVCTHPAHRGEVYINIVDYIRDLQRLCQLEDYWNTIGVQWNSAVEQVKERIIKMENEIKTQEQQIEEFKQELKKKDELIEAYSKVLKQELK